MALISLIFPFVLLIVVLILDRVERSLFPQLEEPQPQQLAAVDDLAEEETRSGSLIEQRSEQHASAADELAVPNDEVPVPEAELRQQALFRVGASTVWLSRPTRPARSDRRHPMRRSVRRVADRSRARRDTPWRHAA